MNPVGLVVAATVAGVLALAAGVSGWRQPRPSLRRTTEHLHRRRPAAGATDPSSPVDRVGVVVLSASPSLRRRAVTWSTMLHSIDRSAPHHVGILVIGATLGFVAPAIASTVVSRPGSPSSVVVPLAASLITALATTAMLHQHARSRASEVHLDMRHQLSAYLDMVTMLLAGNTGHEGALRHAADVGDGQLFVELRRRMREVGTTGGSLVGALDLVADDYGLEELRQVAATTALTAAEGAPVARTLAAKCATLRSTMAAEAETEARIRTDKVTPPLVGMALVFMALIIYPALSLG